jgi:hypothetical protein
LSVGDWESGKSKSKTLSAKKSWTMLTTAASIFLGILKYYFLFESCIALFIILEGIFNIHLGIRSTFIKVLMAVFKVGYSDPSLAIPTEIEPLGFSQFGNNRVQNQLPNIELTQKPERVWNALAADSQVLEDDEIQYKPLQVG